MQSLTFRFAQNLLSYDRIFSHFQPDKQFMLGKAQTTQKTEKVANSFWLSGKMLSHLEADNSIISSLLWTSNLLTIE